MTMRFVLLSSVVFLLSVSQASALAIPSFPSCPNPGGTQIASYTQGTHGIPGRTEAYIGSDTVFQINSAQVVQCYCAPNETGIQTHWWKVSSLSPEDKAKLITDGWVYIPDGTAWGLEQGDWMAYNLTVSCGEKGGGSSSSSSTSNSDSGSSSSSTVTTIVHSILGFADTGRQLLVRNLFLILGLLSILGGVSLLFVKDSFPRSKR